MNINCPNCEKLCDAYDEDRLISVIIIYFECECGTNFQRIYKYDHTR